MGLIYKPVKLHGTEEMVELKGAMFDTGSFANVIGDKLPDGKKTLSIGFMEMIPDAEELEGIAGQVIPGDAVIFPKLEIDQKFLHNVQFTVVPGWKETIIGYPTLQEFRFKIDMGTDTAYI